MTITLSLTMEQEARLHNLATERGVDERTALTEIVDEALGSNDRLIPTRPRVIGLKAAGIIHMSDDFTAPLPDSF